MITRYNKAEAEEVMNNYGAQGVPFLFVIDFEMQKIIVTPVADLPEGLSFHLGAAFRTTPLPDMSYTIAPITYHEYEKACNQAIAELSYGNSFLLNLTFSTRIDLPYSLRDIYNATQARYKLLIEGECVVFSPEIFVKINQGKISSYPMKGTIDALIPDAKNIILNDSKETEEHYTIVDLIRNDLSIVATQVEVERFRYIERLKTDKKDLLQVSSCISGRLPENYPATIGSIVMSLLPAGSISGAPKPKTVEIIQALETGDRGYYTGVMGYFDGVNLDSGVLIRYIEQRGEEMYFRSGCGITHRSDPCKEYDEMIDKIYLPVSHA